MIRELRIAIVAAVVLTVVLGLAYPLAMTGAAQVLWPRKADGDPTLIGKDYSKEKSLFQSRPSVTGYAPDATFFNNQGPNQKALADQLKGYLKAYLKREQPYTPGLTAADVPPDAVTTSASGVDPQISYDNARIQANRVAKLRALPLSRVLALVDDASSQPLLGLGGPTSVNVVKLNDALEALR
jgi:K+-transporting ATPase ATPase C chain